MQFGSDKFIYLKIWKEDGLCFAKTTSLAKDITISKITPQHFGQAKKLLREHYWDGVTAVDIWQIHFAKLKTIEPVYNRIERHIINRSHPKIHLINEAV